MTHQIQSAVAEPPNARMPALDGLRGIAILLVMVFHYEARAFPWRDGLGLPFWAVVRQGWLGVDLFFVLSGFLITGILCDSRGARGYFTSFYARRTLRIFPLYYASLAVAFLVLPALFGDDAPAAAAASPGTQAWFWLYLSNFLVAFRGWDAAPIAVSHFWSLAVEEQFYLLWPAIVLLASPRALSRICLVAAVLALACRVGVRFTDLPWYAARTLTPARLDMLCLGAWVAVRLRAPGGAAWIARRAAPTALAAGLAYAAVVVWRGAGNGQDAVLGTVGNSFFAVFAAAVTGLAATAPATTRLVRALSARPLRFVGRYSYGMYVLHYGVMLALGAHGLAPAALERRFGSAAAAHAAHLGANVALTIALAVVVYHVLERPFLALKERFPYGRGGALDASPTAAVP